MGLRLRSPSLYCSLATLLLTLTLSALLPTGVAHADPKAEARALFEKGNRHLQSAMALRGEKKGRALQLALDAYVQSLRISRHRNVVFNTAVVLQELGRDHEAFSYYREYLESDRISDAERKDANERIKRVESTIGVVHVTGTAGAEIRIGSPGTPAVATVPAQVAVRPGDKQTILVSKRGYEAKETSVMVGKGQNRKLQVVLKAVGIPVTLHVSTGAPVIVNGKEFPTGRPVSVVPGEYVIRVPGTDFEQALVLSPGQEPVVMTLNPPLAEGTLRVTSNVSVRVFVDGSLRGEGIKLDLPVVAGNHNVVLDATNHEPARSEVRIQSGETTLVDASMTPRLDEQNSLFPWPMIAWIAGGVSATAFVYFAVDAVLKNADYESNPTRGRFDDVESANLVADVLLGTTAALLGTALLLTVLDRSPEQAPSTLTIGAGPTNGGAVVSVGARF